MKMTHTDGGHKLQELQIDGYNFETWEINSTKI